MNLKEVIKPTPEETPGSFLENLPKPANDKTALPRLLRIIHLPNSDSPEYQALEETILLKNIAPFFMDEARNKDKERGNEDRYQGYFQLISQKLSRFPDEEGRLNLAAEILNLMKSYEETFYSKNVLRKFGPNDAFIADSYEENPENIIKAKMCAHILADIIKRAEAEQGKNKPYKKILLEKIGRVTLRKITH